MPLTTSLNTNRKPLSRAFFRDRIRAISTTESQRVAPCWPILLCTRLQTRRPIHEENFRTISELARYK